MLKGPEKPSWTSFGKPHFRRQIKQKTWLHASHQTLLSNTATCLREYNHRQQHQWRASNTFFFKFLEVAKEDTDCIPNLQFLRTKRAVRKSTLRQVIYWTTLHTSTENKNNSLSEIRTVELIYECPNTWVMKSVYCFVS